MALLLAVTILAVGVPADAIPFLTGIAPPVPLVLVDRNA